MDGGYTDGEERTIPVLPVGVIESKGIFSRLLGDTSILSEPLAGEGFTGRTSICLDGNLLDVMLREVEHLKEYPYGCNEQLTTKLLAIYYEEEIKTILGRNDFNNTKIKKQIIEKLLKAQNPDGSFGWYYQGGHDYRITNYILSTLGKVNKDHQLDVLIRHGLSFLSNSLAGMNENDLLPALATLSAAGYPADYLIYLNKLEDTVMEDHRRLSLIAIRQEQGFPYRPSLDSVVAHADTTVHGVCWGRKSYDWYTDDLATTLLAYKALGRDTMFAGLREQVLQWLLFKRKNGYYQNTASSGLVLTTLLPELLKHTKPAKKISWCSMAISGSLKDSVTSFPKFYDIRDKQPSFRFSKSGIAPLFVSVSYKYFNTKPVIADKAFRVRTKFMKLGDSVSILTQGDRVMFRTTVTVLKDAEYVMVEIPIPAGCVQSGNKNGHQYYGREAGRETYRDRTVIYCNALPKVFTLSMFHWMSAIKASSCSPQQGPR
jgi:hypothetical protein